MTPLAVLWSGLAVVALVGTLGGTAVHPARLFALALALPALTGGALVSAYRGDLPLGLLVGSPSALGDTGPVQALLWYLRGPLTAVLLLLPLGLGSRPTASAAVAGAVMLPWAASRARQVLR